ncbi:hypothetical protein J6590_045241, partial [Homalodisca vitripennis]
MELQRIDCYTSHADFPKGRIRVTVGGRAQQTRDKPILPHDRSHKTPYCSTHQTKPLITQFWGFHLARIKLSSYITVGLDPSLLFQASPTMENSIYRHLWYHLLPSMFRHLMEAKVHLML